MSSILRAVRSVGMREAVTPTWLASKCTASLSSTLRTFQTTASALKSLPSWNLTPGRSLKTHLVLSLASTAQLVASAGISTLGASALDRSHCVSESYIGMPVKRLPSKPWSGWPSVRGMSAAVMAMRSTFSCAAAGPQASRAAASRAAGTKGRDEGFIGAPLRVEGGAVGPQTRSTASDMPTVATHRFGRPGTCTILPRARDLCCSARFVGAAHSFGLGRNHETAADQPQHLGAR